jgi:hypothetical protein
MVHVHMEIGKSVPEGAVKGQKVCRASTIASILLQIVEDGIGSEEPMNGVLVTLIPDLIEPFMHEAVGHRAQFTRKVAFNQVHRARKTGIYFAEEYPCA